MDQKYKLFNKVTNELITESDEYTIRERVQELLEDKIGFFVMLEQSIEDDNVNPLVIFLHSDNHEELTGGDFIDLLNNSIEIDDTELEQHEALCQYLDIYVVKA
ncbi:hypothetical protein [Bacillus cereus]|uniref:hypothetical protein n=1 Tax=Bacillus cereus TaxID=1396 RepID=UPI00032F1979|nr:hypothetical protein [Bacillus cereus]EOO44438.1 hypothetical protein ICK_06213 [Bacillus cereus BAG1X2-2]